MRPLQGLHPGSCHRPSPIAGTSWTQAAPAASLLMVPHQGFAGVSSATGLCLLAHGSAQPWRGAGSWGRLVGRRHMVGARDSCRWQRGPWLLVAVLGLVWVPQSLWLPPALCLMAPLVAGDIPALHLRERSSCPDTSSSR